MGLKEEPEFDFNGMLKGIVGSLGKSNKQTFFLRIFTDWLFC
jgi:hypothetical protein